MDVKFLLVPSDFLVSFHQILFRVSVFDDSGFLSCSHGLFHFVFQSSAVYDCNPLLYPQPRSCLSFVHHHSCLSIQLPPHYTYDQQIIFSIVRSLWSLKRGVRCRVYLSNRSVLSWSLMVQINRR